MEEKVYRGEFKKRHYGFDRNPKEEKEFQKLCRELRTMLDTNKPKNEGLPFLTTIEQLILDSVDKRLKQLMSGDIRNDENILMTVNQMIKSLTRFANIHKKKMEKNNTINQ